MDKTFVVTLLSLVFIKIFVKAYKGIDYNSMINLLQLMNDNGLTDITLVGSYTGGIQ